MGFTSVCGTWESERVQNGGGEVGKLDTLITKFRNFRDRIDYECESLD